MSPNDAERAVEHVLEQYRAHERPPPPDRPWITSNMVVSIDGRTTLGGRVADLGTGPDRKVFIGMRAHADAVLVGAGTVRAEGYGPIRVSASHAEHRVLSGRDPAAPPLVIVTNTAQLDWTGSFVLEPESPTVIVVPEERSAQIPTSAPVEVMRTPGSAVDLPWTLARLRERGILHLLTEGGPTLLARLLDAGLLDEMCLTVAPVIAGGAGGELGLVEALEATRRLDLLSHHAVESDVFLRYRVQP